MKKIKLYMRCLNPEAIIWATALILLAAFDFGSEEHFSFCPLHNLGFDFCPGCGLGRSISLLCKGGFAESFQSHYLGVPVFTALLFRIVHLVRQGNRYYKIRLKSSGE